MNNLQKLETIVTEARLIDHELEVLSNRLDSFKGNIETYEEISDRISRVFKLYKEFSEVLKKEN